MKFTRCIAPHSFQPFTLSFTVESAEEQEALEALFNYDNSVPHVVAQNEGHDRYSRVISLFLRELRIKFD